MAKGYEKELRFYVGFHRKDDEVHLYLCPNFKVSSKFIDAQHFASFDEAKKCVEVMRTSTDYEKVGDRVAVVRSLYVEVNGFDIGQVV